MTITNLQSILEAALFVSGRPLTIQNMQKLFDGTEQPTTQLIKTTLAALEEKYSASGIELREVASGYQFQAKPELKPWLSKLWEERAPRYSRAFLETLALIAYRQPITRAEIEDIRGVTISSTIMKSLLEREWIKILGHRDVPGKPALYGTTKTFLDYFNVTHLDELPKLAEKKDLDTEEKYQLPLELEETESSDNTQEPMVSHE